MSDIIDFEVQDGVLIKYNGDDVDITVPIGVTEIGESAFEDSDIESIVIPEGVVTIGESAFSECMFLKKVSLPNSLTKIGYFAFQDCDELAEIVIPEGVKELSPGSFSGCAELHHVELPVGLTSIGGGAFQGCELLLYIKIPQSVTEICDSAFAFCENLVEINFPHGLQKIGGSAFEGCTSLTTIALPDTVRHIDDYAFQQTGLKTIDFSGTRAQWDSVVKGKNWNKGTSIKVRCSDSATKESNKLKPLTLKDFKKHGIPVKVTSIVDWKPLANLSFEEANIIWAANYALAKRRIGYMLVSFFILAAAVLSFLFLPDDFYYIGVIFSVYSIISLIPMSFWRKQLNGYKFFCSLYKFPTFGGFTKFLFYVCKLIGFLYLIISFIIIFIIMFVSSSSGNGFSFHDRLGIPENIGQDEVIALGLAHDEAVEKVAQHDIETFVTDLDHKISKNSIDTEYNYKNSKIDEYDKITKEYEKHEYDMTFEEKEELNKRREKSNEAHEKLDKSYGEATEKLEKDYEEAKENLNHQGYTDALAYLEKERSREE